MNPSQITFLLIVIGLVIGLIWYSTNNAGQLDKQLLESLNGNRAIARQLQDAVKGNKPLARRLLAQAQDKYPGKSERWYVEKIIYDLERDRAGGRGSSMRYKPSQREVRENIYLISAVLFLISSLSSLINGLFRGR